MTAAEAIAQLKLAGDGGGQSANSSTPKDKVVAEKKPTGELPTKPSTLTANLDPGNNAGFNPYAGYDFGPNWLGDIFDDYHARQVKNMPLMYQMYLTGRPQWNANLSSHEDTDKYARLANAYNARYRYIGPTITTGGPTTSSTITYGDAWKPVEKIDTQDLKQMDQLRQAQGDIRQHGLAQEQFLRQQAYQKKLDEANLLVNQHYQEQFFNQNEGMRRLKERFDMWRQLNEEQFRQELQNLNIPDRAIGLIQHYVRSKNYVAAMMLMQKALGVTMSIQQYAQAEAIGPAMSAFANGEIPYEQLSSQIAQLTIAQVIAYISGALEGGKNNADIEPYLTKLLTMANGALNTTLTALDGTGDFIVKLVELVTGKKVTKPGTGVTP